MSTKKTENEQYIVMHRDKEVALLGRSGCAKIFLPKYMPYDLYLEEDDDIDTRINNLNVFYHWCASRILSLDRKYAKQILNSIGVMQAVTDQDRARIALSYHCVSLTDVFWIKSDLETISFKEINLYDHHLNDAIVDVSLRGETMTVSNQELAPDLSTHGCFAKAWIRGKDGFRLLKDGGEDIVRKEIMASRICQCFDIPQVVYRESAYKGQIVTESSIITSKDKSIVSIMAFDIYARNHDLDTMKICRNENADAYYGMNLIDYLIGNVDRHMENWGFLVDNDTNDPIGLYPIMDFNQSFLSYDTLDGAKCLTVWDKNQNQREAAIDAVKNIGIPIRKKIESDIFDGNEAIEAMFRLRLEELYKYLSRRRRLPPL